MRLQEAVHGAILNHFRGKEGLREMSKENRQGITRSELQEDISLSFDGKQFTIVGTKFKRAYQYDQSGEIAKFLNGRQNQRQLENYVNAARFKAKYTELIRGELNAFYTLLGDYFTTIPEIISTISSTMTDKYPILVAPIAYSKYDGEKVKIIFCRDKSTFESATMERDEVTVFQNTAAQFEQRYPDFIEIEYVNT